MQRVTYLPPAFVNFSVFLKYSCWPWIPRCNLRYGIQIPPFCISRMAYFPVHEWVLVFSVPHLSLLSLVFPTTLNMDLCWTKFLCASVSHLNIPFSFPIPVLTWRVVCTRQGLGDTGFRGLWHTGLPSLRAIWDVVTYGLANADPLSISSVWVNMVHPFSTWNKHLFRL